MWATSPCVYSHRCPGCTPQIQTIAIAIVCPPELDSKTISMKTPNTCYSTWRDQVGTDQEVSFVLFSSPSTRESCTGFCGEKPANFIQPLTCKDRQGGRTWLWVRQWHGCYGDDQSCLKLHSRFFHRRKQMCGTVMWPRIHGRGAHCPQGGYTTDLLITGHSIILSPSLYLLLWEVPLPSSWWLMQNQVVKIERRRDRVILSHKWDIHSKLLLRGSGTITEKVEERL